MAKAKHKVRVNEAFTHTTKEGALVVEGKEISPARERTTNYAAGEMIEFHTKKDAEGFAKFHRKQGHNVEYVGKD